MSLRARVKPAVEGLLARGGPASLARWLHRRRVAILAYHNVRPGGVDAAGERTLHIGARAFARHLDALVRTHRVVPLRSVVDEPRGPDSRPRAVITFDDAYLGALTAGAEELRRRGLTATVFVAPALLGGRTFWWDALADPDTGTIPSAVRRHALETLAGDSDRVLAWARDRGQVVRDLEDPTLRSATLEQLRASVDDGVLEPASHSWAHRNLAALTPEDAAEEVRRAGAWLTERFPSSPSHLVAYPYGLHPAPGAEGAWSVPHVGFGLRGRLAPARFRGVVPRINVPAGLTTEGLTLRTSGLRGR